MWFYSHDELTSVHCVLSISTHENSGQAGGLRYLGEMTSSSRQSMPDKLVL